MIGTKDHLLIRSQHHSICDAFSTSLTLNALSKAYDGIELKPIGRFKDHVAEVVSMNKNASKEFWIQAFSNIELSTLSILKSRERRSSNHRSMERELKLDFKLLENQEKKLGVTRGVTIQTIWALLLHKYTRKESVVFGMLTSGREQDIKGVERYNFKVMIVLLDQ